MALPLAGVRVLEMSDGRGEGCGRFLADLGAEVVLVEPSGGASSRRRFPLHHGESLPFAAWAANKSSVIVDIATGADRARLMGLLSGADIWIDGNDAGVLDAFGLGPSDLRCRFPHLVVVSVTDFGLTGPYRDWIATDGVHLALTPSLSRSGVEGQPPLVPPGALADVAAGVNAAWVTLLAYWNRLETGEGDHLDVSVLESTAQVIDPATGSIGTAAAAQSAARGRANSRGRPPGRSYPIFACADGYVRLVVLAPRQWRGLFAWLGEPEEFADPSFGQIPARFRAADRLYPLIESLFSTHTMLDLVGEGQRRGAPIAPVLPPAEVLNVEHFVARDTFVDVDVAGAKGRLPSGYVLIDGARAGVRTAAPAPGDHDATVDWDVREATPRRGQSGRRPLEGLRVLDLGVIVVGAEAGRLFADQGADVIKVESRQFPDGARAAGMTTNFASGHRNKRSVGINLRDPRGVAVFDRLVAVSDVVLTNFKPGTIESLGIGYDRLRTINPGIVLVTSSAMGEWGPWFDWMGYGPLVRCVSGLTNLWNDPRVDGGFGDATTIYPDHLVGRVVDVTALAALIARRTTGRGAHIESSQAETIITALSPIFLRESLQPGTAFARVDGESDAPWGVYPCAGDDEWCVITVRHDDDWARLVRALDAPPWANPHDLTMTDGRVAGRERIDAELAAWTSTRAPRQVAELLQAAGVPAAPMQRVDDWIHDPHLRARSFFRTFTHPLLQTDLTTETGPCVAERLPDPTIMPAPLSGEQTRAICQELLGMGDVEIDELLAAGALEEPATT